jgi:hypothetical protein
MGEKLVGTWNMWLRRQERSGMQAPAPQIKKA